MSADFRTEHFKAYLHPDRGVPYIHVVHAVGEEYPAGDFSLGDVGELVELAGQAWPACPGVKVQFVIEARRPGQRWAVMWSAVAADEDGAEGGVSQEFADATWAGFAGYQPSVLEYRLVRRTTVTADEVLQPRTRRRNG